MFRQLVTRAILVLVVAETGVARLSSASEVRRDGMSGETQAAFCIQRTLGKTVLWLVVDELRSHVERLCAASSREEIMADLKAADVLLFEDQSFVLLQGRISWASRRDSNLNGWYAWTKIHVDSEAVNYVDVCQSFRWSCERRDDEPPGRKLASTELAIVREAVLKEAATFPVSTPVGFPPERDVAKYKLQILVDSRRLQPGGPETILAVWTEGEQIGRLLFGSLQDGHFAITWQSAIIITREPDITYYDVNNDGSPEILISALDQDLHTEIRHLTIFDLNGKVVLEDTDPNRLDDPFFHLPLDQVVRPITSVDGFLSETRPDGTVEISASPFEDGRDGDQPRVFRIVNGKYQLVRSVPTKPTKPVRRRRP